LHLAQRVGDGWVRPANAGDEHCHLMVQCMESWFLADRHALKAFFGHGFKPKTLPAETSAVEDVDKAQIYAALADATKHCKTKEPYGKGKHSVSLRQASLNCIDRICIRALSRG
jgi:Domain of unknown function (DUF4276)